MAWTGQQWEEKRNEFDEYGKVNQHLGFDLVCMINPDEITIPLYLASDDKNGKKKDEKKDKKKKFFWIIDVLGYVAFCQNLVFANRSTHVINKTTADGAWAYLLLLKYREWDPNELTRRYGEGHELEEKQRLLSEALEQVSLGTWVFFNGLLMATQRNGDAAKEFWKKQAARQVRESFTWFEP